MYELKELENGFKYIEIQNSAASAKIALQGAHIFSFKRSDADELLWLSNVSAFEMGSAIRGGIPLCWPRFGNFDKSLPQHGFARTAAFELVSVREENEKLTTVHLRLESSDESKKVWNYEFVLDVIFHISESLEVEMITTNRDTKEFLITQAFHTYFQVSDIQNIKIVGLQNKAYLDTLINEERVQKGSIRIDKEVDRIYKESAEDIILEDGDRAVHIGSENSASVIVWNPWIEKCSKMSSMDIDGYKKFVCIESANALDDFRMLTPNESISIGVKYFI